MAMYVARAFGAAAMVFSLAHPVIATEQDFRRPYGDAAPWNTVVTDLPRLQTSEEYADLMWTDSPTRNGNFNLTFEYYTYPVYYLSDATTTARVETTWFSNLDGKTIPWNPDWLPAKGTDAQIILLDPDTGREWNFFQVSYADGVVSATNANLIPGNYWNKVDGYAPSRGAGIPYLAMLVRPEEIENGIIEHALSMPIKNPSGRTFVAPATKLEKAHGNHGIPQAMRFALDITEADIDEWIEAMPPEVTPELRRFGRIVARALRDYGWFITDVSGNPTLQFEAIASAQDDWDRLGIVEVETSDKLYPRDLLDDLVTRERIYTLTPSDLYP